MDMKQLWAYLDSEVIQTPMPKEYENYLVDILCKDCHKESLVKFHVVGLKCDHCGGYNTCRTKGKPTGGTVLPLPPLPRSGKLFLITMFVSYSIFLNPLTFISF